MPKDSQQLADTIQYDTAYWPVRQLLGDGTRIDWQHRADDTVETTVTLPQGEPYVIAQAADGSQTTW